LGVDSSGHEIYSLYFWNLNFVVVPFSVAVETVAVRVDSSYYRSKGRKVKGKGDLMPSHSLVSFGIIIWEFRSGGKSRNSEG
jgi:hypothetical protein